MTGTMGDTVRSFADLHCHTSASFDSLSKPEQVARAAAQRGLTHLAITDHDRVDAAQRARDAAPDGLHIITGQEVRTSAGDLIALYIEEPIKPGLAPYDAAQQVRDQGGVVGLAHPFDRFRQGAGRKGWEEELERVIPLLDYVEAWNARIMVGDGNTRAAEYAKIHDLPGTASSDAHTIMEVGVAYTILDGPLDTADEFRAALAAGPRLVTAHGSRLIRLGMPFAKMVQRVRGNPRMSV
jgi:predicted metal-dependent phosphoesterase TrpH